MLIKDKISGFFSTDSNQPRGKAGEFISKEKAANLTTEDIPDLVHQSSQMTGALKDIKEGIEEKKLEEPLVEVRVNNPLSWFKKWLTSLKKKQTTTVTFKLGIPLIALPVIIVALLTFILGISSYQNKQVKTEATPPTTPTPTPDSVVIFSRVGVIKGVKNGTNTDYYVVLAAGEAIKLIFPENITPTDYLNKRVLVSGKFDKEENVLQVVSLTEVAKETPTPTSSPIQTPTPTSSVSPTASPSSEPG